MDDPNYGYGELREYLIEFGSHLGFNIIDRARIVNNAKAEENALMFILAQKERERMEQPQNYERCEKI
ncbi:MAG: hypothetical protein ABIE22_03680 [archaeon]